MKTIFSRKLVLANVDGNNNKWYQISVNDDFSVQVVNGRVGYDGQTQPLKCFGNEAAAMSFAEQKLREKLRKGYKAFEDLSGGEASGGSLSRLSLEMAASKQIRTRNHDDIKDLIQHLVKSNVHSILSSTTLKYDDDTGMFKTPLGVVTKDSIDQARSLLSKLAQHIQKQDFTSADVKQLLSEYLMLIPQKVGRKLLVEDVLPDGEAIQRQNGILDDLETSIEQVAQLKVKKAAKVSDDEVEIEKIFNCEINLVDDPAVIAEVERFYGMTRKTMHMSYKFKVKRVFEIVVDKMAAGFEEKGKKVGNIQRLWHGTRAGNVLSILKGGLIIPPSNGAHVTGRLFGDGIYFSDQSTKSLNYACGYWGGSYEKNCFMFLADVAMGRSYTPTGSDSRKPQPNTDSTFAIGGKSGVINNEMIIFRLEQANLKYLVEFHE